MVDRRVPGNSEPASLRWACPVPGCKEEVVSLTIPTCRLHGERLKPEDPYEERRERIREHGKKAASEIRDQLSRRRASP